MRSTKATSHVSPMRTDLVNVGSTWYMLSVIQALTSIPAIRTHYAKELAGNTGIKAEFGRTLLAMEAQGLAFVPRPLLTESFEADTLDCTGTE